MHDAGECYEGGKYWAPFFNGFKLGNQFDFLLSINLIFDFQKQALFYLAKLQAGNARIKMYANDIVTEIMMSINLLHSCRRCADSSSM